MQMTSDRQLDWNAVPDVGGKLPSGIVQLRIMDWEEKQTNAEGRVEKGERAGQPKIAKLMYQCHFEGVAPEEAVGLKWSEYYVFGSDLDPQAYQQQTIYDSIGARQAKKLLADAQVPWSSSLVGTFSASIGAMVLLKVDHKKEKRRDTGEDIVACRTGRSYKVGEAHPQYIPCLLDTCDMCVTARASGLGTPLIPQGGMGMPPPPAAPKAPAMAPGVPPAPTAPAPLPPAMPSYPAAPVAPPATGPAQVGVGIPGSTTMAPAVAPVAPPAPVMAPVAPPVAAPVTPAPVPQMAPVAPAAPVGTACPFCQQIVAMADFAAHIAAHSAQTVQQFQQEA